MNRSKLLNDKRNRQRSPVLPDFDVCGNNIRTLYFMNDGIYLKLLFFANPLSDPRTKKDKLYCAHPPSAR